MELSVNLHAGLVKAVVLLVSQAGRHSRYCWFHLTLWIPVILALPPSPREPPCWRFSSKLSARRGTNAACMTFRARRWLLRRRLDHRVFRLRRWGLPRGERSRMSASTCLHHLSGHDAGSCAGAWTPGFSGFEGGQAQVVEVVQRPANEARERSTRSGQHELR
jgi:hypothetical protein